VCLKRWGLWFKDRLVEHLFIGQVSIQLNSGCFNPGRTPGRNRDADNLITWSEKGNMTDLRGKKLPTVAEVEIIMSEYGKSTVGDFAERFGLERIVVEATIDCLRRLRRISGGDFIPAISCYRDDKLESIVRCAGSKHGYA
jgi:hypothetical protein